MSIWILVIDHKYGTDTYAFSNEETARAKLDAYMHEWWDDKSVDPATLSHEERVERYFYGHPDCEWYVLRPVTIDGN